MASFGSLTKAPGSPRKNRPSINLKGGNATFTGQGNSMILTYVPQTSQHSRKESQQKEKAKMKNSKAYNNYIKQKQKLMSNG